MKNIYLQLIEKLPSQFPFVLATVTKTRGSTPQKSGSSALFGPKGLISGTVGGGYVERSVESIVSDSIISGKSGHYHFDLDNEISVKDIGVCGGSIGILVDASPEKHHDVFIQMRSSISERIPGVLITTIKSGENEAPWILRQWVDKSNLDFLRSNITEEIASLVEEMISLANPLDYRYIKPSEKKSIEYLLESVVPSPRLIIVGAGHIGKAICRICSRLDFEILVLDDRENYAIKSNLPEANEIIVDDVGKTIKNLKGYSDTYIIIVSRSHSEDALALEACINSDAPYIGMIGSKRKIALMKEKFLAENITSQDNWNAVYTPVGIDINAKTVEEIAISIAAQLIQVRSLRNQNK